jgi:hypothetical protein
MLKYLILLLLSIASSAFAANWYVRPTAQGAGTGSDWNNAWSMASVNSNQGLIQPGDTIWIAGGTYTGNGFNLTKSGTAATAIKYLRATADDAVPVAAAGWQSSFDSQVFFSSGSVSHTINASYVTIDGRSGFTAANRFKDGFLSGPQSENQGTMFAFSGNAPCVNLSIKFFAIVGFYGNNSSDAGYGFNSVNSTQNKTNVLFQNCSVRGFCEAFRLYTINSVIVDNCYIADTYSDLQDHEDFCYTASPISSLTISNCVFNNSPNDGWFFETGNYSNITFAGNFFYGCGTVFAENKTGSVFTNFIATNNIFACPSGFNTGFLFNSSSGHGKVAGSSLFQNNILINGTHDFSSPTAVCSNNAYSGSSVPKKETGSFSFTFSNQITNIPTKNLDGTTGGSHGSLPQGGPQSVGDPTGDAHLTSAGIALFDKKGAPVPTISSTDPDGNIRDANTPTIGVFQIVDGEPTPTPVPTLTPTAVPTLTPTAVPTPTPPPTPPTTRSQHRPRPTTRRQTDATPTLQHFEVTVL